MTLPNIFIQGAQLLVHAVFSVLMCCLVYWVGLYLEAFQLSARYSDVFRVVILVWLSPSLLFLCGGKTIGNTNVRIRFMVVWSWGSSLLISLALCARAVYLSSSFVLVPIVYAAVLIHLYDSARRKK